MGGFVPPFPPIYFMERQKRLFILNDDHVLNRILKEFFKEYGIKVYAFADEIDFDAEIREKKPHAILLDVGFSSASPAELIEKIKKSEAHMPVIVMAGMEEYARALDCLRAGAYSVLKKPFSSYEISRVNEDGKAQSWIAACGVRPGKNNCRSVRVDAPCLAGFLCR